MVSSVARWRAIRHARQTLPGRWNHPRRPLAIQISLQRRHRGPSERQVLGDFTINKKTETIGEQATQLAASAGGLPECTAGDDRRFGGQLRSTHLERISAATQLLTSIPRPSSYSYKTRPMHRPGQGRVGGLGCFNPASPMQV
jgi:hypothetical protein